MAASPDQLCQRVGVAGKARQRVGVEHGGELRSSSSSSSSVSAPVPVFLLLLALPARGAGASEAEGAAEHPKSSFLKLRGAKSETEDEKKFPSGL